MQNETSANSPTDYDDMPQFHTRDSLIILSSSHHHHQPAELRGQAGGCGKGDLMSDQLNSTTLWLQMNEMQLLLLCILLSLWSVGCKIENKLLQSGCCCVLVGGCAKQSHHWKVIRCWLHCTLRRPSTKNTEFLRIPAPPYTFWLSSIHPLLLSRFMVIVEARSETNRKSERDAHTKSPSLSSLCQQLQHARSQL